MRSKEIQWEQTIFKVHEWEWIIFRVHKQDGTIHEWEQMILWYARFQDIMRNDQEMTEKWPRMIGKYPPWLFMTNKTLSYLSFMNNTS